MNIANLRELKKLIQLCQSQGVKNIEIDGIKLELSSLPSKPRKYKQLEDLDHMPLEGMIKIPQMQQEQIDSDEPSAEDMLFYSSDAQQPQ